MSKADNRKVRSRRKVCLKLAINTSKKKSEKRKHHSKQRNVHSTPEKDLTEFLDSYKLLIKTRSL